MNRPFALSSRFGLFVLCWFAAVVTLANDRPNILFIMADDHACNDREDRRYLHPIERAIESRHGCNPLQQASQSLCGAQIHDQLLHRLFDAT